MSLYYTLISDMEFDHHHFCLCLIFFKVLVSVFCIISFFFFQLLFFFGLSLLFFLPVSRKLPTRKIVSPVRVTVWINVSARLRIQGNYVDASEMLRFIHFVICAKLHFFVYTKWTKWSKLDYVYVFET